MMFEKDTIMGQVLSDVNEDDFNKEFLDGIEELIEKIADYEYISYVGPRWNKNGLTVTDMDLSGMDKILEDRNWVFLETANPDEYSWLIYELEKIYEPTLYAANRLFTTIGYLIEVYEEKYQDLGTILTMVALVSTVWLHPDHIGQDRFVVHPIKLPKFGKEF